MHYHDKHIQNEQIRKQIDTLVQRLNTGRHWWQPTLLTWAARKGYRGWLRSGEATIKVLKEYLAYYRIK
jgi:hypothetical protein